MLTQFRPIADSSPTVIQASSMQEYKNLKQAQDDLYDYFIQLVKCEPYPVVLHEFRQLFIYGQEAADPNALNALYSILLFNQEGEFRNTLKRCCYILVNQWELNRQYHQTQALVNLFADETLDRSTFSPTLRQLRTWLRQFIHSQDYQDLCLFAFRHQVATESEVWSDRYRTYSLVQQVVDYHNPLEQRQAAQVAATRLKNQFKFDLAMYTARCQLSPLTGERTINPTQLGDEVLWLVKTIVASQGFFKHHDLANLFLQQTTNLSSCEFKSALLKYLTYSIQPEGFTQILQAKLATKLEHFLVSQDETAIDPSHLKRICNYAIDCLTTEDEDTPSALFHLFQLQSIPLTLVILLLKVCLICPESRTHLDTRLADLIRHHSILPSESCQDFITFLEILQVAFAICCEDVEYNLVEMRRTDKDHASVTDLNDYRLFSRSRKHSPI